MTYTMEHINPGARHYLHQELKAELEAILNYWTLYSPNPDTGGFYGKIDNDNIPDAAAPTGLVMCSRILWAFSAGAAMSENRQHREIADRAFHYILDYFIDKEEGGAFWSLLPDGQPSDTKKQLYGQAFCLYGLAEYYRLSGDKKALQTAAGLYKQMELHGFDKEKNGYIEAFARDWSALSDLRLSAKDHNERKTMNTHLHVIEAYANLYTVWADDDLKEKIRNLLGLFDRYFIDHTDFHLRLFFDDDWHPKSELRSYGHDIEAAWLLQQCAEIIGDKDLVGRFREMAVPITNAAAEGLDTDGGLWYEYEPAEKQLIREKHSWPQAEALVGFYNAWQLTGDKKYYQHCLETWAFIRQYIRDHEKGEWFWGVFDDYRVMPEDKAGFWKCPYHNTRALLELIRRINL
jgi:cellobiose epimerase